MRRRGDIGGPSDPRREGADTDGTVAAGAAGAPRFGIRMIGESERQGMLVKHSQRPAVLVDAKARLIAANRLCVDSYRTRFGIDLARQRGLEFERFASMTGLEEAWGLFRESRILAGELLLLRIRVNSYGAGHVTQYDPIFEGSRLAGIRGEIVATFESRLRSRYRVERVEAVHLDAPDELVEISGGLTVGTEKDDAAYERVRRAAEFIRANADRPLTVSEIAKAVGTGPRSLQAAFRDRLRSSPLALLSEVRLDLARAQLLEAEASDTVTDVALTSGFTHLGRFAAAYRRRFGEPPSETLRRGTAGRP